MAEPVKTRAYRSAVREERARLTRHRVLVGARELFVAQGYTATTVAQVAARAGVAVDTVYAAVGTKPELFRQLWETAISGSDDVVPAEERDYVRRVREAPTARAKLTLYAAAVTAIQRRIGPLHIVLRDAAGGAPELRAIRDEISQRRSTNMRRFAADLVATGSARPGLGTDEIGDIIWATSSADMFDLLVQERGWTPQRYEQWLLDSWLRTLLAPRRRKPALEV
ncbi:MAG TPA: helix-turn-helix domain-containing protein [Candidatus Nanopelagicales bacterium]|nr:helix-turn-helix domain-containing protein [Candidatus Nanopelagicales bacterium]